MLQDLRAAKTFPQPESGLALRVYTPTVLRIFLRLESRHNPPERAEKGMRQSNLTKIRLKKLLQIFDLFYLMQK